MAENLSNPILITIIGMSLVFGSILLLWITMVLLVKVTSEKTQRSITENQNLGKEKEDIESEKIAAVIGVAYAMTIASDNEIHPFPLPSTAFVSAWQAVMRSKTFNARRPVR